MSKRITKLSSYKIIALHNFMKELHYSHFTEFQYSLNIKEAVPKLNLGQPLLDFV